MVRFEGTSTPTNSMATLGDEETLLRSKSGKGKGRKKGTSLTQLRSELGTRFVELAVPDGMEEIRSRLQSSTGEREVVKGGIWGLEATQESMDTYVLPQKIPDSQEEVESDDEDMLNSKEWKKKVDETLQEQIEEVSAAIVGNVLEMVETIKAKSKRKKEEKLGASKYAEEGVTKERFQEIVDQLEKGAESAGWKEEGTMKEDTEEANQKEPDTNFSWKAQWDSSKSWKAVEDILRNAETHKDLRGVRMENRKIKRARKAAGAMIAAAGWALEMGATTDRNGEKT